VAPLTSLRSAPTDGTRDVAEISPSAAVPSTEPATSAGLHQRKTLPQIIWVSQHGDAYHLAKECGGLASAKSANKREPCLRCAA
jgi:hypothetical protein